MRGLSNTDPRTEP